MSPPTSNRPPSKQDLPSKAYWYILRAKANDKLAEQAQDSGLREYFIDHRQRAFTYRQKAQELLSSDA